MLGEYAANCFWSRRLLGLILYPRIERGELVGLEANGNRKALAGSYRPASLFCDITN